MRFSANILHRVLWMVRLPSAIHSAQFICDELHGKLLTLVAGKRRRLFMTGDDDEVFMTMELQSTLYAKDNRTAFNSIRNW